MKNERNGYNCLRDIFKDKMAFSSTIDSLIFLILISVAATVLLPSITGFDQDEAAYYRDSYELETHLLETLLSAEVEECEYDISPLESIGLTVPEDVMKKRYFEVSFGKEQNHRTFADLIAEELLMGLWVEHNNSKVYLNPTTKEHEEMTRSIVDNYLQTKLGGTYKYRLEGSWYPISGYMLGSNIIVGYENPPDAVKQKVKITLPISHGVSRSDILYPMNDSTIMKILNCPSVEEKEHKIKEGFNKSIEVASLGCAEQITETVFPAEYLRTWVRNTDSLNGQKNVASVSDAGQAQMLVAPYLLDHIANTIAGGNVTISQIDPSPELLTLLENEIIYSTKTSIVSHLTKQMQIEIDHAASQMAKCNDTATIISIRDNQIDSIYYRVNNAGADITLILW